MRRMLPASDLERWTASEPTSSLPTGPVHTRRFGLATISKMRLCNELQA
jgi:hypothetical protein